MNTIADLHVISALKKKRSELSGDLIKLDKQKALIKARIAHVDATLKLFGYIATHQRSRHAVAMCVYSNVMN